MIPEVKKEFCMYLGPNIVGVIQTARVFRGSKYEVCQQLADARRALCSTTPTSSWQKA